MKQKADDRNVYVPKKIKKQHLQQLADYKQELCQKPQLRSLFIEMTILCNEHCRHCGSRCGDIPMEQQLEDEEILSMLAKLKTQILSGADGKQKLPFLCVTGGEPLLRPTFCELMKACYDMGYHWGMTSNGLLLDEKMAGRLKDAGMATISISIDGLEQSHDWFRQTKGGYQAAMQSIRHLVRTGFQHIMVTTVVHKRNIDELEQLYPVIKATGCDAWRIINVEPIGRALEDEEICLDTGDYQRMIQFIMEKRAKDSEMEVTFGCNHFLGPKRERELRSWYYMCTAGLYTAGIFYNGDIGGCLDIERRPETIQGNIRKDDFYEVWEKRFEIFRKEKSKKSKTCKNCKHRTFCDGGGFHTWNLDEGEPRLCMYREVKKTIE